MTLRGHISRGPRLHFRFQFFSFLQLHPRRRGVVAAGAAASLQQLQMHKVYFRPFVPLNPNQPISQPQQTNLSTPLNQSLNPNQPISQPQQTNLSTPTNQSLNPNQQISQSQQTNVSTPTNRSLNSNQPISHSHQTNLSTPNKQSLNSNKPISQPHQTNLSTPTNQSLNPTNQSLNPNQPISQPQPLFQPQTTLLSTTIKLLVISNHNKITPIQQLPFNHNQPTLFNPTKNVLNQPTNTSIHIVDQHLKFNHLGSHRTCWQKKILTSIKSDTNLNQPTNKNQERSGSRLDSLSKQLPTTKSLSTIRRRKAENQKQVKQNAYHQQKDSQDCID